MQNYNNSVLNGYCVSLGKTPTSEKHSFILCFTHALTSGQITQYQLYNWQLEPLIHVFLKTFSHSYKANNCTVALLRH